MKNIDELLAVLPPPKRPLHHRGDWAAVETAIGLRLPPDYKEFIATYGSGTINDCLEIMNPLGLNHDLRKWWSNWSAYYDAVAEYEPIPCPVYPTVGGLLPFGTFGDVDILNWRTEGEPEHWPFVYFNREEGFFEVKGLTAVGFVLEALTGTSPLLVRLRREWDFVSNCQFRAYTPDPKNAQLVHPHEVDIDSLVEKFVHRWPSDQVRVQRRESGVKMMVEALDGSMTFSREGDERTFFSIQYDQSCAAVADVIIDELNGIGFTTIRR